MSLIGHRFLINVIQKKKYRQELTPNAKYQRCRVFVRNDLIEKKKKIKSCRKSSKRFFSIQKKS